MGIAINIDVNAQQQAGAPLMTVSELKEKVQAYVNSLYVHIVVPSETEVATTHRHSLSSLRGICKSGITDEEAIDEYLSLKY